MLLVPRGLMMAELTEAERMKLLTELPASYNEWRFLFTLVESILTEREVPLREAWSLANANKVEAETRLAQVTAELCLMESELSLVERESVVIPQIEEWTP